MFEALRAAFATAQRIAIVTHVRPDGDAMGSSLGLADYLAARGHQVTVITPSAVPDYLTWLPGATAVADHPAAAERIETALGECPWLFALDFGQWARTEALAERLRGYRGQVVNIDHHLENEGFAQYPYLDTEASSTCELVYRFLSALDPQWQPTAAQATCLYTGLMTDTGSFRFSSTTPAVHRVVAELLEAGADVQRIHRRVYDSYTERRTRLLGYCLSEKLRVLPELRTAYITLSAQEQARFGVVPGDTEGIVNYALGIRGMNLGVILIEYPDQVKLSFRSVGQFSAAKLAGHFAGGGHYNAAGGQSTESLAATEAKLLQLLHDHSSELNYTPDA